MLFIGLLIFFFFSPGSSLWEADVSRVGLNVVNAMSL